MCVCVCACVRMCVCKCVRVHTVLFFSEKPGSHGFNISVTRAGCVYVCVYVCVCMCVCVCVCVTTQGGKQRRARGAVS